MTSMEQEIDRLFIYIRDTSIRARRVFVRIYDALVQLFSCGERLIEKPTRTTRIRDNPTYRRIRTNTNRIADLTEESPDLEDEGSSPIGILIAVGHGSDRSWLVINDDNLHILVGCDGK